MSLALAFSFQASEHTSHTEVHLHPAPSLLLYKLPWKHPPCVSLQQQEEGLISIQLYALGIILINHSC